MSSLRTISSAAFSDTKPHYELLDGLRGVAALVVIWYHVFEAFATSPFDQRVNHGHLAVDFFFILSGFVIGYAYDDRWATTLTTSRFFKRRLIRLHPMVVLGVVLGVITFCLQGSVRWDGASVPFSMVMLAMLLNLFLLPVVPGTGADVRGHAEMYPLNGPNWSLFFEYIGNILYALALRKMPTRVLAVFVALSGAGLAAVAFLNLSGYWHLGMGWSLLDSNFPAGLLRMLFSFSAGLLISRNFKPLRIRGAFWICSLSLVLFLSVPHLCDMGLPWLNAIYEVFCVLLLFPLLVYIGASGQATDTGTSAICKFLGDISYPVLSCIILLPISFMPGYGVTATLSRSPKHGRWLFCCSSGASCWLMPR